MTSHLCRSNSSRSFLSLLSLTVFLLVIGDTCCSTEGGPEGVGDHLHALTFGLDNVYNALRDHRDRCQSSSLSSKVEDHLSTLERIIEAQWARIDNTNETVHNASRRARDMVEHYYSVKPTSPPDACPEPFERAALGCFWLHKNPSQKFEDARRRCQQEGGDLATPKNLTGVRNYLSGMLGYDWLSILIGGRMSGGSYKWVTTGEEMTTERDDWHSTTSNNGQCVAFNGGRGYRLVTFNCQESSWYLCEIKVAES